MRSKLDFKDIFNYNEDIEREKWREKIPQGCGLIRLNRKTKKGEYNEINVCVYQRRMEETRRI